MDPQLSNPAARALALVRGRLTFANVVAVTALFVALGGSSYAALRVGSEQIANNSVGSKDLRNNGIRGRDIAKDTIRGTDVRDQDLKGKDIRDDTLSGADLKESSLAAVPSAADAHTLGGKVPGDFLGSGALVDTGLVKLALGETKTVVSSGPFTWKAACSDGGGGTTHLTVTLVTTEPDTAVASFGGPPQTASPGSPATVFDGSESSPAYAIGFPLSAVAPTGGAPVGLAFVGLNVGGADCLVNGHLTP